MEDPNNIRYKVDITDMYQTLHSKIQNISSFQISMDRPSEEIKTLSFTKKKHQKCLCKITKKL